MAQREVGTPDHGHLGHAGKRAYGSNGLKSVIRCADIELCANVGRHRAPERRSMIDA
jgi:hypothetical protein